MLEKRGSSVKRLVAVWAAYWLALGATTFGGFALTVWRLSRTAGDRASVSAGFNDWVFNVSARLDGATVWAGSASVATIALLVAGPPLVAWAVWLSRSRRLDANTGESPAPALREGAWPDADPSRAERRPTRTPLPR